MEKKLKLEEGGYNYFENLPDELVILIFTKLSSSEGNNTLDDIKSLGRSSLISKRFNALTCLVPTLTIYATTIPTLYEYCPKILKKFKDIRSLRVGHLNSNIPGKQVYLDWEVIMDGPHKYSLAVVACTDWSHYTNPHDKQSLMIDSADEELIESISLYTTLLFTYHHILISSIKDHKFLQSVVIADLSCRRCTLTLDEDILVKMRNCGSIDLEKVDGHMMMGSVAYMDIPAKVPSLWYVLHNVCFGIIKRWEKVTDDNSDIGKDDDDDFKFTRDNLLTQAVPKMLKDPETASVSVDDEVVLHNLKVLNFCGYSF